jgi:putative FmdB family regulatory protein
MPIYEYRCDDCAQQFECFVRPSSLTPDDAIACPSCRGQNLQRLLSLFAVNSQGTRKANLAQARKAGMKTARDKRHAEMDEIKHMQEHHG